MIVASNAIVVRKDGQYVCVVGPDNKVHYAKVELGRDHGSEVEIVSGLDAGKRVVLDPPDSLLDGTTIKVCANPVSKEAAPGK